MSLGKVAILSSFLLFAADTAANAGLPDLSGFSNLPAYGMLCWYAYYVTAVAHPKIMKDAREDQAKLFASAREDQNTARKEYIESLSKIQNQHNDHIEALEMDIRDLSKAVERLVGAAEK